jgi:hypothetical protein
MPDAWLAHASWLRHAGVGQKGVCCMKKTPVNAYIPLTYPQVIHSFCNDKALQLG